MAFRILQENVFQTCGVANEPERSQIADMSRCVEGMDRTCPSGSAIVEAVEVSSAREMARQSIDKRSSPHEAPLMICPACGNQLVALGLEGLVVDICRGGCGGIWFDNFELKKVDEAAEKLGATLAALEFNPKATIVQHKRPCPRCADITMLQHKFSPAKPVVIDECPNCGGMWLDGGELAEIRRRSPTADDRKAAAQRFFSKMFIEDLARLKTQRANNSGSPGEIGRTAGRATD